jgi:hypothetical protein
VSVPMEVSLAAVRAELVAAGQYAAAAGLHIDTDPVAAGELRFYVTFANRDSEHFYAEFNCAEYPMFPPNVEFVSRERSERGAARLYPQGFHPTPCVCMRYNRKAYGERGGPHSDWRLLDWRLPTGNGVGIDSLALTISDLHSKILQSSGRMA